MKRLVLTFHIAIVACLAGVVMYHIWSPEILINDSLEYKLAANNMVDYNTLYGCVLNEPLDFRLYGKRTLGYPIFILFQLESDFLILLVSVSIYALIFFLGINILAKFTQARMAFMLYLFLFVANITLALHTTFVMADLLLAAIITAGVSVCFESRISLAARVKGLSLLWAIGLLLKPVLLPSLILAPVLLIYFKNVHHKWYLYMVLPFVVFIVGSFVNMQNTQVFEYSSISTINLGQYNSKLTVTSAEGKEEGDAYVNQNTFQIPRNAEEYAKYKEGVTKLAFDQLKSNPLAYAKVHLAGMIKMILDPGRFELYTFFGVNDKEQSLTELLYAREWQKLKTALYRNKTVFVLFVVLFLLSIIKLFIALFSISKNRNTLLLWLIIFYFIAITGPIGAARFMMPVSILYSVLICLGAERILNFFKKRTKS